MGLFSALQAGERATVALERIADALERLAPAPPEGGEDGSWAGYVDDVAAALLEARQEAYFQATGRRLGGGEEPPSPLPPGVEVIVAPGARQ